MLFRSKAGLFLKSKKINPDSITGGFGFTNGDVNSVKITTDKGVEIASTVADETLGIFLFELSADVRARIAELPKLTWSPVQDGTVLLVCDSKKTSEYKNIDNMIKQNTMYKHAMFLADQQLKQLRRKAVIVINDERYKL